MSEHKQRIECHANAPGQRRRADRPTADRQLAKTVLGSLAPSTPDLVTEAPDVA